MEKFNKKIIIISTISLLIIGIICAGFYYNQSKKTEDKYSIGFSFNDGFNVKIDLGTEKNDKFKVDVTNEHVHINGAGSIIKRIFDWFSNKSEEKQ